ncbi:hypothetical protein DBB36_08570 [Flavobacterium sp. WLB]|uniref:hypothetical protein n=1 Tax=unclassified Flavobacterium TaxID=196869 RepID=UPI0006AB7A9A|nr:MULTISPECIES: hypothetical protein [unclassified Flavobacterium]KOP36644.1 hypothetical protein AKO67_19720 [Flavobacterium sp. VMW]OWU91934.1 hypothetical protein APR43_04770 [Flavobacterium sp. NLM]PUU70410.1 hypothetical protein DBB36_08570 [Flavobacterium sp. WLB]
MSLKKFSKLLVLSIILGLASCNKNKAFEGERNLDYSDAFDLEKEAIKKIEIFSYPDRLAWDTLRHKEIIRNNKIDFDTSMINEKVTLLKETQIKELFGLIKIHCKVEGDVAPYSSCYMPRNLILFYNKENRIIAHIEVCFECGTSESSNNLRENWDYCKDDVKDFFKKAGIKYFVDTNEKEEKERLFLDSLKTTKIVNNKVLK